MQPEDQPRVPVISSDGQPLMPCRPKRARVLLRDGRAEKTWINGNFAIRMTDRTRDESTVHEMTLGITPGSKVTGFAITQDQDETQERRVIHAMELEHIGHQISIQLQKRTSNRKNRRFPAPVQKNPASITGVNPRAPCLPPYGTTWIRSTSGPGLSPSSIPSPTSGSPPPGSTSS